MWWKCSFTALIWDITKIWLILFRNWSHFIWNTFSLDNWHSVWWTGVVSPLENSRQMKQIKSWSWFQGPKWHLSAVWLELLIWFPSRYECKWRRPSLGWKTKQIYQSDRKTLRVAKINSVVNSSKDQMHWWAQQHRQAWKTTWDK